MTRQQYLKSKGWEKQRFFIGTGFLRRVGYRWILPGVHNYPILFDIAWEIQMEWQGDEYSWLPPQEIKTGRLKI